MDSNEKISMLKQLAMSRCKERIEKSLNKCNNNSYKQIPEVGISSVLKNKHGL